MRFDELHERRQHREFNIAEAVEMLGLSEQTIPRLGTQYKAEGVAGLDDRQLGRALGRIVTADKVL
jgi:hypothetical protein